MKSSIACWRGRTVTAYDPVTRSLPSHPEVTVVDDPYAALELADVLSCSLNGTGISTVLASTMPGRHVIDGRNLLDRSQLIRRGFTYRGIGR
ncbi:MAG: hypothetical protein R2706_09640 [Acidimicrobiales bacterium]